MRQGRWQRHGRVWRNSRRVTAKSFQTSRFSLHLFPKSSKRFQAMQPEERQAKIEAYLQKAEFASLEELAQNLGVSVSTVRRDVAAMEATHPVRRTHGGARLVQT